MITKVSFRRFMGIRQAEVPLERFTVFVGPNGSGKTSVLRGLWLLCQLGQETPSRVFRGNHHPRVLSTQGGSGPMELSLSGKWTSLHKQQEGSLTASFSDSRQITDQRGNTTSYWDCTMAGFSGGAQFKFENAWQQALSVTSDTSFVEALSSSTLLQLDPRALAAPSADSYPPMMDSDGEGLASLLAEMAVTAPEDLTKIQQALAEIVPSFKQVRFQRVNVNRLERVFKRVYDEHAEESEEKPTDRLVEHKVWGHSLLFDTKSGQRIPAELISEGTLIVLGLLTAILGPQKPNLILLDDLDRSLHPVAQQNLIGLLRRLLDMFPSLQIVATSHSPYLLDHFHHEEVRLVTSGEDGTALFGALTDHPEFARWKDLMAPGELWSAVGEGWLRTPAR